MILKNAFVSVNGVDLSDHIQEVNLEMGREGQDDTVMGHNTRTMESGLKTWSLSMTFKQNYDAAKVDVTLFTVYDAGAAVAVAVRPDQGVKAATNPEFSGQAILESYTPLGQAIGDFATAPCSFTAAGDLTRSTA